jgi:tetratricopeptide (TPR) repeat protein
MQEIQKKHWPLLRTPAKGQQYLLNSTDWEDASAILETIPTAESYYNLGIIHAELKNWVSSRTAFEKALEAKPDFAEARENLESINAVIAKITARYGENYPS